MGHRHTCVPPLLTTPSPLPPHPTPPGSHRAPVLGSPHHTSNSLWLFQKPYCPPDPNRELPKTLTHPSVFKSEVPCFGQPFPTWQVWFRSFHPHLACPLTRYLLKYCQLLMCVSPPHQVLWLQESCLSCVLSLVPGQRPISLLKYEGRFEFKNKLQIIDHCDPDHRLLSSQLRPITAPTTRSPWEKLLPSPWMWLFFFHFSKILLSMYLKTKKHLFDCTGS